MRRAWWAWLFVALVVCGRTAWADAIDDARALAAEARERVSQKRYREAAELYARAHQRVPSAEVKYNEARCWELAEVNAAAADAYEIALKIGTLDATHSEEARRRLDKLEPKLAVLVVAEPVGGSLDVAHVKGASIPARVHLLPGEHQVRVADGGRLLERRVVVVAQQVKHLSLPPRPKPAREPAEPRRAPEPPIVDAGDEGSTQRTVGWIALGLGGASAVASAVLGGLYLDRRATFIDGEKKSLPLHAEAATFQRWTTGTWIAGAVVSAAGIVLVLTAPGTFDAGSPRVAWMWADGSATVDVSASW